MAKLYRDTGGASRLPLLPASPRRTGLAFGARTNGRTRTFRRSEASLLRRRSSMRKAARACPMAQAAAHGAGPAARRRNRRADR